MIRCPCRAWPSVRAFLAHRDAGACPHNAPKGRAFVGWALSVRALTPAEVARKEAARARVAELRANPEYVANAKRRNR